MRNKFGKALAGLAGAAVLGGLCLGESVIAQGKAEVFTIRYICFTATPLPGNTIPYNQTPPVLQDLRRGSRKTLAADPQSFLGELRRADASFRYDLVFAGRSTCNNKGSATVHVGPRPGDMRFTTLTDSISVERTSPTTVSLRQTGRLSMDAPEGDAARRGFFWNGVTARSIVLGQTYHHGISMEKSGRRVVLALSVHAGDV